MEPIEFRVTPTGEVYFQRGTEKEKRLTRFETEVCLAILEIIRDRFPGAWSRLHVLYKPKAKTKVAQDTASFAMIERFIRCNFGEHDLLTPDIEHEIMHFEEVKCPLRGICQDENIICKPQSLIKLTPTEKEITRLYLWGDTFDQIARKLDKSPSTIKSHLFNIKKKLNCKNCREIIKVMRVYNI